MIAPPLWIVDAFVGEISGRVLRGNPAAVLLLEAPRESQWMQGVAAEMNLSETAFLWPEGQDWRLRWFTPLTEVELCGHATLASAHVLWHERGFEVPNFTFHTLSGPLRASRLEGTPRYALDFPAQIVESVAAPVELLEVLGLVAFAGVVAAYRAEDDWLLSLPVGLVETLRPDFSRLREVSHRLRLRGVIVTAQGAPDAPFDFVSRFFAPGIGIDEDPVTGSAHTKLGPFWAARLEKTFLVGYQASARGGLVGVECQSERLALRGEARTCVRGWWVL